jgi:hypothetical protein
VVFELRYTLFSQLIENTLWFEESLPWNAGTIATQCEVLHDWVVAELFPALSANLVLREVFGTSMESDSAPTGSFVPAVPPAGDSPAISLPGGSAFGITFRTGNRGRSFRGRNYIPGIPDTERVGNQVTSGFANTMQAAYQQLTGLIPEMLGTWVVVSRFSGGLPRVTGVTTPVVQAAYHDLNLDSQRRRLTGRGT